MSTLEPDPRYGTRNIDGRISGAFIAGATMIPISRYTSPPSGQVARKTLTAQLVLIRTERAASSFRLRTAHYNIAPGDDQHIFRPE